MSSEHDLHAGLRRVAEQLDRAGAPIDAAAVAGRRPPVAPRPTRALLAAAAVLALLVGVVALVAGEDRDEGVHADVPPASSTTESPGITTIPSGPTGLTETTLPAAVVPPSYEGVPWEQLPLRGQAEVDADRITLVDEAGAELGSFATADVPRIGSTEEPRLLIRPGLSVEVVSDIVEEGGCRVTGANGARVAACGPDQDTLALLRPTGETVPLTGMALDSEAGHWVSGQVSPDGRWVLAQWSGECEVPKAFFVPTAGGPIRTVDGFTSFPGEEPFPANSGAVGWTTDGQAVVVFHGDPACGSGDEQPGTYLVDPDTGVRTPAEVGGRFGAIPWERADDQNERERALARAGAELGVETCCGEPAHGGGGVTGGIVWDGVDVFVGGGAPGPITIEPGEGEVGDVAPGEVDGLPVTTWALDGRAALAFTCGATRWVLGGAPVLEGRSPTPEALRALASTLVPRLYCTVGEPPTVAATG